MKKTLILCICFIWLPLNTEALNLKYENKGNYYVSINNAVYKLNKIMDLNTNEYLFNMYFDNYKSFNNYIESKKFNNEINEELFNNINNAIFYGYISKNKSDIYYYITQILIYKYYYGFDNVYMSSSTGNKLQVYEDIIFNIHNNYYLSELSDINIVNTEELNLDNKYRYDLSNFNTNLAGIYEITYYLDENYKYYYNNDNMYFSENSNVLLFGKFNVSVEENLDMVEEIIDEEIIVKNKNEEEKENIIDHIETEKKEIINNIDNPKTYDKIGMYIIITFLIYSILAILIKKVIKN